MIRDLAFDRPTLVEQLKQRKRVQEYWQTLINSHQLPALTQALKLSSVIDGGWNDPEYQRFRQEAKERSRKFMQGLLASLDVEQWAHLEKTLDDLANEMQAFGLRKN